MLFSQWSSVHKTKSFPVNIQSRKHALLPKPEAVHKKEKDSRFIHKSEINWSTRLYVFFLLIHYILCLFKTSSTVRSNQQPPHQPQSEDVGSMKATHEQPVFFESWPSAEDGSPPANTSTTSDVQTYAQKAVAEKLGISSQPGVQENSTLAKYVVDSQSLT